jgi:hypothetical protein
LSTTSYTAATQTLACPEERRMLSRRLAIVLAALTLTSGAVACGEAREKGAPGEVPDKQERQRQQIQQPSEATPWEPTDRTIGERIEG